MAVKNNDVANVSYGKPKAKGAIFIAPKGTTLPTDGTTALDPAFKNLGYISDDGLKSSTKVSTEEIRAWGGDTVLVSQKEYGETYSFNMLEVSEDTLGFYYGAENVTKNGDSIVVKHTSKALPEVVAVFEIALTGGRIQRTVLPHAQFADRSAEITYKDNKAIEIPVKLSALPDADGTYAKDYFAKAV